ncbi:MAG: helix-turn-helix domain-containing protein [Streptococcaceae bacterium]|jgi:hypothetical protein|nr:helix-turn-helix domain-containing protein [Streptococcaceae bacterium]
MTDKKIPYTVIVMAVREDVTAINLILKHFEPYINRLSQKTILDEKGVLSTQVSNDIKQELEAKLIVSILNFQIT